ncbi:MAG: hypothetical protein Q8R26_02505 [bacterium]|nr:hypothetical protein [bacterium]
MRAKNTAATLAFVRGREHVAVNISKLEFLNALEPMLERDANVRCLKKNRCPSEALIALFALDQEFMDLYRKGKLIEFSGDGHLRYLSFLAFFKKRASYSRIQGILTLPRFVRAQRHFVWCSHEEGCGRILRRWHKRWSNEIRSATQPTYSFRLSGGRMIYDLLYQRIHFG